MVGTGTGLDAQVGVCLEGGGYGLGGTVNRFFEFNTDGIVRRKVTVQGTGLRAGGRFARAQRRVITTRDGQGTLTGDFVTSGMGVFLAAVNGTSTITAGSNTTLAASCIAGAPSISVTGPVVQGQSLLIDVAGLQESRVAGVVTGAGPYAVAVAPLTNGHANGATVVVAGGPTVYTQTHTPGALRGVSMALQKGVPTTSGTVEPFTYVGCKILDLDISIAKGGLAVAAMTFDAQDEQTLGSTPAGPALATASYSTTAVPFSFLQASLLLGGVNVAAVTKANVKLTRPMKVDRYFLGAGGLKAEPLENAWQTITGSLDADFTTRAALYDSFASDASLSLVLSFVGPAIGVTGTNASLTITVPAIKLDGETPKVAGPDVVQIVSPFVGLDNAAAPPVTYTLVSADSAY